MEKEKNKELLDGLLNEIKKKFEKSNLNAGNATALTDLLFDDPRRMAVNIYELITLSIVGRGNHIGSDVLLYANDVRKIDELFTIARTLNELAD